MIPSHVLRVMDANVDRCQEGLRVLEDVARFVLNDGELTARLRDLRHGVAHAVQALDMEMLAARRAQVDVGAGPGGIEEGRQDLQQLVRANAKRVEEALRVLEEFVRLQELSESVDVAPFKSARFAAYEVEQLLVSAVTRAGTAQRIRGLYVILDPAATVGRSELEAAEEALKGGASVIQFRDKVREKGIQLPVLTSLGELCHRFGALLIVNKDPDMALAVAAGGLHVGQKDLPLPIARRLLMPGQIIGVSCATVGEAQEADALAADYIAVGSMFPTSSKLDTRPAGLETLRQVRAVTARPLVAIGGITVDNVDQVMAAGADAVAVISAVAGAAQPEAAARALLERMKRPRGADSSEPA